MRFQESYLTQRVPWRTMSTTPDRFSLPGKSLVFSGTNAGTAYIDTTNLIAGYSLDDGQNNVAIAFFPLPANWGGKYYQASWVWVPASSASGTVRFGVLTSRLRNGSVVSTLESVAPIYSASSGGTATPAVTTQPFASPFPTDIGPDEYMIFNVRRRADQADDTYNDDIYLIAVTVSIK